MKRVHRGARRRTHGIKHGSHAEWSPTDLLDDAHVGGLLISIRAVGSLIGIASPVADPAQIGAAGWLVEALAEEARTRLQDEVSRRHARATSRRRHRPR